MILPMFLILNSFRADLAYVALLSAARGVTVEESKETVVSTGGLSVSSWLPSPDLEVLISDVISGDEFGLIGA